MFGFGFDPPGISEMFLQHNHARRLRLAKQFSRGRFRISNGVVVVATSGIQEVSCLKMPHGGS